MQDKFIHLAKCFGLQSVLFLVPDTMTNIPAGSATNASGFSMVGTNGFMVYLTHNSYPPFFYFKPYGRQLF